MGKVESVAPRTGPTIHSEPMEAEFAQAVAAVFGGGWPPDRPPIPHRGGTVLGAAPRWPLAIDQGIAYLGWPATRRFLRPLACRTHPNTFSPLRFATTTAKCHDVLTAKSSGRHRRSG